MHTHANFTDKRVITQIKKIQDFGVDLLDDEPKKKWVKKLS